MNKKYVDANDKYVKSVILYGNPSDYKLYLDEAYTIPVYDSFLAMLFAKDDALISVNGDLFNPVSMSGSKIKTINEDDGSISLVEWETEEMIVLEVASEEPNVEVLGKQVVALQSEVKVYENEIRGTLKYVTGYTGFSADESLQSGYFLALAFDVNPADTTVTVEVVNGISGPVTLDEDMNCVFRISSNVQKIKVVATKGAKSVTKIYDLRNLIRA